jgi:hypothetical protein
MSPVRIFSNKEFARKYANLPAGVSTSAIMHALQATPPDVFSEAGRHQVIREQHLDATRSILAGIMGGTFPESFDFVSDDLFQTSQASALAAERLWERHYPDDFVSYHHLIEHVVYAYRDTYAGGSVSNCIGWIWLSPAADWDEHEYLENLVHEYTHNVLFLEEMVHTLFSVDAEQMARPENQVVSAIRRVPRFFDQAYHAAAVAIVLAEVAVSFRRIDQAEVLLDGLLISLDALKEKRPIMSSNGFELLEEMIVKGLALYEQVNRSATAPVTTSCV